MDAAGTRLRELKVLYTPKIGGDGHPVMIRRAALTSLEVASVLCAILENEPTEVFGMLCLSTKRHVLGYYEVSRGTLDGTHVHPREVFKAAVLANAAAVVLAHNHPSGEPTPSPDDLLITIRLLAAGELIGIDVLDHLIVGHGRYISLRQDGYLNNS